MLGHILSSYVRQHTGSRTTDTRKDTDTGTDQRGTEEVRQMIHKFLPAKAKAFYLLDRNGFYTSALHALRGNQDIRDRKDTDQSRKSVKACHQVV